MPQRYSGIRTKSKCDQPEGSTETAVRRKISSAWKSVGPISRHQSRNAGCQRSSARCSRGSPERSTLFGMRESSSDIGSERGIAAGRGGQVRSRSKAARSGLP